MCEIFPRGVKYFRVSQVFKSASVFFLHQLLRVQLSRQLLQVPGRDDAVIGDERLDDEEAFIFSSLMPVFVTDKLSNGV